jgi:Tol biopolymer transport system component
METGEIRATRDTKVTGDITWSPDGTRIAFTALRTTENLYTVIVLLTSDFTPLDLYAAGAATDDFGSAKGIVRWTDNNRIHVNETCGVDCSRVVEINISGQGQQVLQTGRKQDGTSLKIALNQKGIAANPEWQMTNASPDGSRIFYVDQDAQAWMAAPDEGYKYRLTLDMEFVQESKWSPGSQLIAVRTDENIFLYDLECSLDLPE